MERERHRKRKGKREGKREGKLFLYFIHVDLGSSFLLSCIYATK